MTSIDIICFFLIVVLLILSGMYRSKSIVTDSSYLFGSRKTSLFSLTATLVMMEFNSATLISFSSLGYSSGFWALVLPFVFLLGLLFYALTVAKKWKAYDGESVAGFFRQKYGSNVGIGTSVLLIVSMLGFSAVYVKSLTLLFEPMLPFLNRWVISGSLLAIILCMSIRGGLMAIIRTDIISFILMFIFFPLIALFMWKSSSLFPISDTPIFSIEQSQTILPLRFVCSLVILTMFTYILAPWYGQKIFAARSEKVAYWSVILASMIVFFLYGSAIVATAFLKYRGYLCDSPQMAFPNLIHQCLPIGIKGCMYALLFATSATTLTGIWSAIAAMWMADFTSTKNTTQKGCYRSIMIILSFAFCSYLLSNTLIDQVFDKMILANIPVAALSFGLLAGFYWKRASKVGVIASIIAGCICGISAYGFFGESGMYTWYWAMYGIPFSFFVGIVGSFLYVDKKVPIYSIKS